MDGRPSPGFSWWIENKFHSLSGLRFHRIIYFQVSRAVCFSHNRSFLPFPHTCQLLSASAVIYVLLQNCMTKLEMAEDTAARKSLFPDMVSAALQLQKFTQAQGSLADALRYCTTHIQDGNASTKGPIFTVYFEYFKLHICKERSGSIQRSKNLPKLIHRSKNKCK